MMVRELAWEIVLASVTTGGGVLFFVGRYLARKLSPIISSLDDLPALLEKVDQVAGEVQINSGKSLKDAVIRIEARLAHLDSRQWALLQDVEHAILETSHSGTLLKMNRTYQRWTGRSPAELLGNGWRNAIHPDDRQAVVEEWVMAVEQKRDAEMSFRLLDVGTGIAHPVRAHCFIISPTGGWVCNIYRLQHDAILTEEG